MERPGYTTEGLKHGIDRAKHNIDLFGVTVMGHLE